MFFFSHVLFTFECYCAYTDDLVLLNDILISDIYFRVPGSIPNDINCYRKQSALSIRYVLLQIWNSGYWFLNEHNSIIITIITYSPLDYILCSRCRVARNITLRTMISAVIARYTVLEREMAHDNKNIMKAIVDKSVCVFRRKKPCYRCVVIHEKHHNVLQYKESKSVKKIKIK